MIFLYFFQLSKLSMKEEKFIEAIEDLEQAKIVASREGFANELKRIMCLIGIAKGEMEFPRVTEDILNANEI